MDLKQDYVEGDSKRYYRIFRIKNSYLLIILLFFAAFLDFCWKNKMVIKLSQDMIKLHVIFANRKTN